MTESHLQDKITCFQNHRVKYCCVYFTCDAQIIFKTRTPFMMQFFFVELSMRSAQELHLHNTTNRIFQWNAVHASWWPHILVYLRQNVFLNTLLCLFGDEGECRAEGYILTSKVLFHSWQQLCFHNVSNSHNLGQTIKKKSFRGCHNRQIRR